MNIVLWIIQILLALMFLFAGGTKLILPLDVLKSMGSPNQVVLPGLLLRFIGVCEVLGALGLVLPGLLRIRPGLTPLAAAGLLIIMIGAVALTIVGDGVAMAIAPLIFGVLCAFVAYGRWHLAPLRGR
jgi:uncharacterized membrane protein YphA (DoxX/SURF4 family)